MANVAGSKKEGGTSFTAADFCNWKQPEEEKPAGIKEVFALIKAQSGVRRNGK